MLIEILPFYNNRPKHILLRPTQYISLLQLILQDLELLGKLLRKPVAELGVVFTDALAFLTPQLTVNAEDVFKIIKAEVCAVEVDVLRLRLIAYLGLNGVRFAEAACKDPFNNTEIVAEAGPQEVTLVIGTEPVYVEYFRGRMLRVLYLS